MRDPQFAPALVQFIMHELVLVMESQPLEEGEGDHREPPAVGYYQVAEGFEPLLLLLPMAAAIPLGHILEVAPYAGVPGREKAVIKRVHHEAVPEKPAALRRRSPNPVDRLGPLWKQVRRVIQTIHQNYLIDLVMLAKTLLQLLQFITGVEAGLRQQVDVPFRVGPPDSRSEEHTSELQSLRHLVC